MKSKIIQSEKMPQASRRRSTGLMAWRDHSIAALALLAGVALLAGCGGAPTSEPSELETVDVKPGLEVDSSQDPKAASVGPQLVGILPGDFPSDLPIHLPASIVDLGDTDDGRAVVTLLTPHDIARVRREIYAALGQRGWTTAAGEGGAVVLKKGSRRAWLYLDEGRPGTLYRYEYQP